MINKKLTLKITFLIITLLVFFSLTAETEAAILHQDNFEYVVDRDSTDKTNLFQSNGGWNAVKSEPTQTGANGYLYTSDSLPGYEGAFPGQNSSRVLALEARPIEGGHQTDFYLQFGEGEGSIGQIPPNHWVQFWIYSEHTVEHPSYFTPQSKFLYYNRATYYPATLDNEGYVFIASLHHTSGAPLSEDPCSEEFICDQGFFSTGWESDPLANDGLVHGNVNNHIDYVSNNLGANLDSEAHVMPNNWALIKMHFDLTGTDPRAAPGQAVYEQWIKSSGNPDWEKTTEFFGGVTIVNSQVLDFYPRYTDGFRMVRIPTTVGSSTYPNDPRDNTREYWVYLDDFVMADSESSLPVYEVSPDTTPPAAPSGLSVS